MIDDGVSYKVCTLINRKEVSTRYFDDKDVALRYCKNVLGFHQFYVICDGISSFLYNIVTTKDTAQYTLQF